MARQVGTISNKERMRKVRGLPAAGPVLDKKQQRLLAKQKKIKEKALKKIEAETIKTMRQLNKLYNELKKAGLADDAHIADAETRIKAILVSIGVEARNG